MGTGRGDAQSHSGAEPGDALRIWQAGVRRGVRDYVAGRAPVFPVRVEFRPPAVPMPAIKQWNFPARRGRRHGRLHMRWSLLAALSASPLVLSALAAFAAAPSSDPARISGPVTHENLTVFFIHGTSAPGKAPLTLEEALAKRAVEVRETGNVNQLEIENSGNEPVFIQAGDI